MSDPRTDRLLREYLDARAEEKAKGITLESVYVAVKRVSDRQIAMDRRVENHARRIQALERREESRSAAEPGPNWRAETTGTWHLEQLQAEVQEHKSDARWLKRQGVQWLGAAIGAFVMAMVSAIIAFVVAKFAK